MKLFLAARNPYPYTLLIHSGISNHIINKVFSCIISLFYPYTLVVSTLKHLQIFHQYSTKYRTQHNPPLFCISSIRSRASFLNYFLLPLLIATFLILLFSQCRSAPTLNTSSHIIPSSYQ